MTKTVFETEGWSLLEHCCAMRSERLKSVAAMMLRKHPVNISKAESRRPRYFDFGLLRFAEIWNFTSQHRFCEQVALKSLAAIATVPWFPPPRRSRQGPDCLPVQWWCAQSMHHSGP